MSEPLDRLTDLFPPPPMEAWREQIELQLKGASFDKRLVHVTDDGIAIQPLYTQADARPPASAATRGRATSWDARVTHANPGVVAEHRAVVTDLERGADSVRLKIGGPWRNGIALHRLPDFSHELDGIDWSSVPLELEAGSKGLAAAAILLAYLEAQKTTLAAGSSLGLDPLAALSDEGVANGDLDAVWQRVGALGQYLEQRDLPGVRALTIDTGVYHLAGASDGQDLGFALATGAEALRALTAAGLTVEQANARIAFTLDVGAEFFAGIAKLRAFRRLWAQVLEASGGAGEAWLQARPGGRMFTKRDPWVNLLRNTAACFAGAVGGAQVVYTRGFDFAVGRPDAMSRRIARNTLSILRAESNLGRVADPAGGAWFIENLTDALAEKGWAVLQQVEGAGGMGRAIIDGLVHDLIEPVAAARATRIAKRKQAITGVSEFPNLGETKVSRDDRVAVAPDTGGSPPGALDALGRVHGAEGVARITAAVAAAAAGATLGDVAKALRADDGEPTGAVPLAARRDAAPFEALRDASDAWLAKTGERPQVFLANLGPVAHFTGRAGWASNFFAAGGLEPKTNTGFATAQAASEAFAASGARVACICSSDRLYAELAADTAKALKAAGARTVILAGRGGEHEAEWRAAGVSRFIHLGCDVLGTLTALMTEEGVLS